MSTHVNPSSPKTNSLGGKKASSPQSTHESTKGIADNRPETIIQESLQRLVHHNPRVNILNTFHHIANNSIQAQRALQFQAMADQWSIHPIQSVELLEEKNVKTSSPVQKKLASGSSTSDFQVSHSPIPFPAQPLLKGLSAEQAKPIPIQAISRGSGWGFLGWSAGGERAWNYLTGAFPKFMKLMRELDELKDTHAPLKEEHFTQLDNYKSIRQHDTTPITYKDGIQLEKDLPTHIETAGTLKEAIIKFHNDTVANHYDLQTAADDLIIELEERLNNRFLPHYAKSADIEEGQTFVDKQWDRLEASRKKLTQKKDRSPKKKKIRLEVGELELIEIVKKETQEVQKSWEPHFDKVKGHQDLIADFVEETSKTSKSGPKKGWRREMIDEWKEKKTKRWDEAVGKMNATTEELQAFRKLGLSGSDLELALRYINKSQLTDSLKTTKKETLIALLGVAKKSSDLVLTLLKTIPKGSHKDLVFLLETKKLPIVNLHTYLETNKVPLATIKTVMRHCKANQLSPLLGYAGLGVPALSVEVSFDKVILALGKLSNNATLLLKLMNTHAGKTAATMLRIVGAHNSSALWDKSVADVGSILTHYNKHVIVENGGGGPINTDVEKFSADAQGPTANWATGQISAKGDAWTIRVPGHPGGTYNTKTRQPLTFWYQ